MRLHLVILLAIFSASCSGASSDESPPEDAAAIDPIRPDVGADAPHTGPDMSSGSDVPSPAESRCVRTTATLSCPYETLTLRTGVTGLARRDVHFQVPATPAPAPGFPVILLFQGSLFSGEFAFEARDSDPFGAIHQVEFVQLALDSGYAVLSPEARLEGSTFWDTNVPPYSLDWDLAPDHQFMLDIFGAIEAGEFGNLDGETMFATGISSGGYMTSRMAVSYPGRFRALAILAASYATCSGALCTIPELPSDHPPTLFVHGEQDQVVPIRTARAYEEALRGITETDFVASPTGGHAWLEEAPAAIVGWFDER